MEQRKEMSRWFVKFVEKWVIPVLTFSIVAIAGPLLCIMSPKTFTFTDYLDFLKDGISG